MNTNAVKGWQAALCGIRYGTVKTATGSKTGLDLFGVDEDKIKLWEDYYTGKKDFMSDYSSYLESKDVALGDGDESNNLYKFIIGTFNLKGNDNAIKNLRDKISSVAFFDGEIGLSAEELQADVRSKKDLDGNDFDYLQRMNITVPDVTVKDNSTFFEESTVLDLDLNNAVYKQCKKAKGTSESSPERIAARKAVAEEIAKACDVDILTQDGTNYSDDFKEVISNIIPKDNKTLEKYNKYFQNIKNSEIDNGTVNQVLDFFIYMNTDGIDGNDELEYSYKAENNSLLNEAFLTWPKDREYIMPIYDNMSNFEERDPQVIQIANDYINQIIQFQNKAINEFKEEPRLNIDNLSGAQTAELIDTLFEYSQNNNLPDINFKGGDNDVVRRTAEKLAYAEKENKNINAYSVMSRLAKLDGYQEGELTSGVYLGGDYEKYYWRAVNIAK